jgi:hypothetical protein
MTAREPHTLVALQAQIENLRSAGAPGFDPVGFHYLDVLNLRLGAESGALRAVLEDKLGAALTAYATRFEARAPVAAKGTCPQKPSAGLPLTELNRYIRQAGYVADHGTPVPGELGEPQSVLVKHELKSVRRFTQTWSRIVADDQLEHAFGRGPENAGPLNSHMLVLRSLSLMRDLSPDYMRRFLSHVDSLLWLEQATPRTPQADGKPTRRSKSKR